MVAIKIIVSGRVQGVFLRKYTSQKAQSLQLVGEVRNLSNGDVEILAKGDQENLDELERWCHRGLPMSRVDRVATTHLDCSLINATSFSISY